MSVLYVNFVCISIGHLFSGVRSSNKLFVCVNFFPDESMRYLFQNEEGKLFMMVLTDWLSSPSPLYKISAALALGNFARSGK